MYTRICSLNILSNLNHRFMKKKFTIFVALATTVAASAFSLSVGRDSAGSLDELRAQAIPHCDWLQGSYCTDPISGEMRVHWELVWD